MFVQEGEKVLDSLQIDEMHFFEYIGLKLFFVAKICFINDGLLADDDTMGCESGRNGLVLVKLTTVFVSKPESVDSEDVGVVLGS